jgi:hypothetical protein
MARNDLKPWRCSVKHEEGCDTDTRIDRSETMDTRIRTTTLAAAVALLAAQGVGASDFVHKSISCPKNNIDIVGTPDGNINIEDVIVSSDAPTDVTLKFFGGDQGNRVFMRVYLPGNDTVVSNLAGTIDGERDASIKMTCNGEAKVDVTIVGSGNL